MQLLCPVKRFRHYCCWILFRYGLSLFVINWSGQQDMKPSEFWYERKDASAHKSQRDFAEPSHCLNPKILLKFKNSCYLLSIQKNFNFGFRLNRKSFSCQKNLLNSIFFALNSFNASLTRIFISIIEANFCLDLLIS